ncbi:MAG TPA: hypothetical protein VL625_04725, partial [Patescibacteria group bacterium]|nr:hypothetical protein [Patescibacteria group bacterium]
MKQVKRLGLKNAEFAPSASMGGMTIRVTGDAEIEKLCQLRPELRQLLRPGTMAPPPRRPFAEMPEPPAPLPDGTAIKNAKWDVATSRDGVGMFYADTTRMTAAERATLVKSLEENKVPFEIKESTYLGTPPREVIGVKMQDYVAWSSNPEHFLNQPPPAAPKPDGSAIKNAAWQPATSRDQVAMAYAETEGMTAEQRAALVKSLEEHKVPFEIKQSGYRGGSREVIAVKRDDLAAWGNDPEHFLRQPPPAGPGVTPKISQDQLVAQMKNEVEDFKSRGFVDRILPDGTPLYKIQTPWESGGKKGFLEMKIPGVDRRQPAVMFEQQYGLTGVSKEYKYPPGMTARDVEDYAVTVWHKQIRGEITAAQMEEKLGAVRSMMEDLNPELKVLNAGAMERGTYHVILGATSGFNPNDIQHFLDGARADAAAMNTETATLMGGLGRRGVLMGWVPSVETLKEIDRQVSVPGYRIPPGAAPFTQSAKWQEATITSGQKVTRASLAGMNEKQIEALENELRGAGFHPFRVQSQTLGETMRIPPEELEDFNKWQRGEFVNASNPNRVVRPGGGNNGPVMSTADANVPPTEIQPGRVEGGNYTYTTPLDEGEVLVRRRRAGFTSDNEFVNEAAKSARREAGFRSNLGETPIDASVPPAQKNTAGFTGNRPRPDFRAAAEAEKREIGFTANRSGPPKSTLTAAENEVTSADRVVETTNAARTATVAGEDASRAARLRAIFAGTEEQHTWQLTRLLGGSEETAGRVATIAKTGGVVLKVLGPVAGTIMTYNEASERVNGNSYTKLLDANGLGPDAAPRDSYQNFQDKNIVDGVAMTIPAGVTQAYWALSSGLRWAVGDVDHRKLLATVVARANSGTETAKIKESVYQYVDSALPWFHYLTAQKQQNVIDNIMAMKEAGRLQDWSQLPGLVGTPGNMTRLQDSPGYFAKVNGAGIKLPDVNKTNAAFYGTDAKTNPGLSAEIAEAAKMENMRKRSQIPDIDWVQARQKLEEGGKAGLMNFLSGQMPATMWQNTKTFFS